VNKVQDTTNIIQELTAPIKTFRVFAIEKAIKTGNSSKMLDALKAAKKNEQDSECQMLLEHAIKKIEQRLGLSKIPEPDKDKEELLENFSQLKPYEQLDFIRNTGANWLFENENRFSSVYKIIKHPVVMAELVKKCMFNWPTEKIDNLEKFLFSESSVLQLACLEALIYIDPTLLQKHFEKLILGKDPLVRALAIRGLAKTYPESAAEFLKDCLRKGDKYNRIAALRVCSVMPFDLIKSALLELLFRETDKRALNITAAIVLANPDKEIPYRLAEQIAKADKIKHKFLSDLLGKTCEMVKLAHLCEDFRHYFDSVKVHLRRNKARFFVLSLAAAYNEAGPKQRSNFKQIFTKKLKSPEIAATVKEINQENPELLKSLCETQKPTTDTEKDSTKEKPAFVTELLAYIGSDENCPVEKTEKALAQDNPTIVSTALRSAATADWVQKAKDLTRSNDEEIVSAAFEYLAKFSSEDFLLLVRGHINSSSLLVRTTLLRSLCGISTQSAIELLESMLADNSKSIRKKAIGSLIHFEFASIRGILYNYLSKEKDRELVNSCLSFYLTNPMLESTFDLETLKTDSLFSDEIDQVQTSLNAILQELGIADGEEIHSFIQEKKKKAEKEKFQEDAKKKEELKKLKNKVAWQSFSDKISDLGTPVAVLKAAIIAAIVIGIASLFLFGDRQSKPEVKVARKTSPIAGKMQNFILVVQIIDPSNGALVGLNENKEFIRALPRPGKEFVLSQGDKVKLRGLPFKIAPDGTILVKTVSIKKIR
jgi:hypothetical protein